MSSNESTDRSSAAQLLMRADAQLFRMESFFNLTSAMLILFLMLLAVVQVVGRKFFNFPIPGYVDWVEMAMAIFCFLSIAYTQKLGGHVRMEFFAHGLMQDEHFYVMCFVHVRRTVRILQRECGLGGG